MRRVAGARPVRWSARRGGYAANERWSVELDDGARVFVKYAPDAFLAGVLRDEHRFYCAVQGSFLPRLVGFDDAGEWPLLVLEDLAHAEWPPPWTDARIDAVRATLAEVRAHPPPVHETGARDRLRVGWDDVERDAEVFLSTGLRDAAWLERALPELQAAAARARVDGDELVHYDVRSDNLCFVRGRAILVDWNLGSRGCGDVDIAGWAPSLAEEGGPPPHVSMPGEPEYAALFAGFFAARAGLPPPPTAPYVRAHQKTQLAIALDWVRAELGL